MRGTKDIKLSANVNVYTKELLFSVKKLDSLVSKEEFQHKRLHLLRPLQEQCRLEDCPEVFCLHKNADFGYMSSSRRPIANLTNSEGFHSTAQIHLLTHCKMAESKLSTLPMGHVDPLQKNPMDVKYPRWFGGSASCMAVGVSHPFDLSKLLRRHGSKQRADKFREQSKCVCKQSQLALNKGQFELELLLFNVKE